MITEDEYDEELMLLNKHERKVKIIAALDESFQWVEFQKIIK